LILLSNLLYTLSLQGVLNNLRIKKAFEEVDRVDFVQPSLIDRAYENCPLPLGWAQTISQPYTVAFMLDLLDVRQGDTVLDIGSGSGWTTALLANMTGSEGAVLGLERISTLVEFGASNLAKYSFSHAEITAAGSALGNPGSLYNKILVSATSEELPEELILQLKIGGILVIPVENSILKITRITMEEIETEKHYGFVFVPLII